MRKEKLSDSNDLLLKASYFFAFLYWLDCENKTNKLFSTSVKVTSTFLLACHSFRKSGYQHNRALNAALIMNCVGDLVIELPVKNQILYAIPVFLIGHLFYSKHLYTHCMPYIDMNKFIALSAFTVISGIITKTIASKTSGILPYAIPVYALGLYVMFILAAIQKENAGRVSLAAFSYLAADVFIAVNKLIAKIPMASYFTWPAYFCGQADIVSHAPAVNRPCLD